jgi:uncharacterized membrane protein YcgQ (UPF0703/DUF1980 family)
MAEYKITYTPDGRVKKELNFKGFNFSYSMIPDEYGKTSDKKGFDSQVSIQFPDEDEDVIDALDELDFADEDEIEEILTLLSEYE